MNRGMTLIGGLGLGAGLMFLLDPQQGRRRRALIRDKFYSLASQADDAACVVARDIGHRACGLAAGATSMLSSGEASDRVIEQRIRSKLGRITSHPRAIQVQCRDGQVCLSGPILAREVDNLLKCVGKIAGVKGVRQSLDLHKEPGNIAALQGGRSRPGQQIELLQNRWAPATRFLVGSSGLALVSYGLTKDAPEACVLGTIGLGLLARSVINRGIGELTGQINIHTISDWKEQVGEKFGQVQSALGVGQQSQGAREPALM